MTTRLALILTGVWSLLVVAGCGGGLWFVSARVPRHQQEARAQSLGGGFGTVAAIGYGAILLPWAAAMGRRRRERQQEQARRERTRGGHRRRDDAGDE